MTVEQLISELSEFPAHLPVMVHVELESDGDQSTDVNEYADADGVEIANPFGYSVLMIRM